MLFLRRKILPILADLRLTMALLAWLGILLVWTTILQADGFVATETPEFFRVAFIWVLDWIPLPGGVLVLIALLINLISAMWLRFPLTGARLGLWLIHFSLLLFLVAAALAPLLVREEILFLKLHEKKGESLLVELVDLEVEFFPGTNKPSKLWAKVAVEKNEGTRELSALTPGRPWQSFPYSLYLADIALESETDMNTIAAVLVLRRDYAMHLPVLASVVLLLGLLLHLYKVLRGKNKGLLLLLLWPVFTLDTPAAPLAVQWEGRAQPLEVWAHRLRQSWGAPHQGLQAREWLDSILLAEDTEEWPLFRLPSRRNLALLGLAEEKRGALSVRSLQQVRYRLQQLAELEGGEFSHLLGNVEQWESLRQSLSFAKPSADFILRDSMLCARLHLPCHTELRFVDLELRTPLLLSLVDSLQKKSELPPNSFQGEVLRVLRVLHQWARTHAQHAWPLIPLRAGEPWMSAWQILAGPDSPRELRQALQKNEGAAEGLQQIYALAQLKQNLVLDNHARLRLRMELWLHYAQPFFWAEMVLWASLLGWLMVWVSGVKWKILHSILPSGLHGGLVLIGLGIVLRFIVSARVPVATFFESLVFVAGSVLVVTRVFANGRRELIFMASLLAAILLRISAFLASGQDTLGVLHMVLDSPFWLVTHVLVISGGYAVILLCGFYCMYLLVRSMQKTPETAHRLNEAHGFLRNLLLLGLSLVVAGTLMGGLWAQEAWGRFWGWDPKENGALLLILWVALLLHGRIGGRLPTLYWYTGGALSVSMVALVWFGVNLLGKGLHSYGFIGFSPLTFLIVWFTLVAIPLSLFYWANQRNNQGKQITKGQL